MPLRRTNIGWMPGAPDERPPARPDQLAAVGELLRGHRIAALTGAGISTDSGLPDYRGPQAAPRNPMTYQQFVGDPAFRRHYWARNHLGWHHLADTAPNAGHRALARLESRGIVTGVITQNVDLLHEQAGSVRVVDLHGHYNLVRCLACGWTCTRAELDARLAAANPGFVERVQALGDIEIAPDADAVLESTADFVVVDCPVCGGMLKPDIVFFGETVPTQRVQDGFALLADSDALLVAGTSLAVMSGLRFVRAAAKDGYPIVILNQGLTRGDDLATVRLNAPLGPSLVALAEQLLG